MAKSKSKAPLTTAQQLGSLIKSARDIMRKDKGLSSDLGRLPMLTWIMFLKFLDDMEQIEESRAGLRGEKYRTSIDKPYRWRDWAAKEDGITGPELLAFINQEEAVLPNGKKGAGLFTYLRGLRGSNGNGGRRQVIATVFSGVANNMISGYLLRDVINKVNGIHFLAKEEMFTLGHLYESMLKEMRDAAGQNGEFYTPRAVVRFMVEVLDPQLGETVLDPACGTGGFLVETYSHLEKQCKKVQDRKVVQERSIFGGEAKPLPYLLCQMNLLLHGLEAPKIDPENSLRFPLAQIGDRDRVDVVMTNPPFGGEEERGILSNFPDDKQTAETALLFLQLIMRKLRRQPKPGRAGVVVPNGVLSASGVAFRIRQELLNGFNLSAVVRLPHNVFAPYTDVATNILFFDRSGVTKDILFCELELPPGINLSKTKPLDFARLKPLLAAIAARQESPFSWLVKVGDLGPALDLDRKNPRLKLDNLPPVDSCFVHLEDQLKGAAGKVENLLRRLCRVRDSMRSTRIEKAILDYYRAFEQRSRWAREELLVGDEVESYEQRLIDEWERFAAALTEELDGAASEIELKRVGRQIFNWMEQTADLRIRPNVSELYVMRGSFHILANKPAPTVWWHPKFVERLSEILAEPGVAS